MNREGLDMGDLVNFFDYTPRYHTKPTEPATVILLPYVTVDRGSFYGFLTGKLKKQTPRKAKVADLEPFFGPAP